MKKIVLCIGFLMMAASVYPWGGGSTDVAQPVLVINCPDGGSMNYSGVAQPVTMTNVCSSSGGSTTLPLPAGATNYAQINPTSQQTGAVNVASGTLKNFHAADIYTVPTIRTTSPAAYSMNIGGLSSASPYMTIYAPNDPNSAAPSEISAHPSIGVNLENNDPFNGTSYAFLGINSASLTGALVLYAAGTLGPPNGIYQGFIGNSSALIDTFWKLPSADSSGFLQSNGSGALSIAAITTSNLSSLFSSSSSYTGGNTFKTVTVSSTETVKSLTLGTTSYGTLSSSPTITPNAFLGNTVTMVLASTITINGPSNPTDSQRMTFRITQDSVGSRTVTWASGSGNFAFGTDITSVVLTTTANAVDYIGAIYSAASSRWHIVSESRGF